MNHTNASSVTRSVEPLPISIPVLICLVLVLGFLLNIFSMWVFKYRTPEWKTGTVLHFHLAMSDFVLCPLAPFLTAYFTLGYWPFGNLMCRLKIVLLFSHFYGSIFFLALISIHRYISVVYHSQEFRMKQKGFVKKLCVGVWVVVLIKGTVCSLLLGTNEVGSPTLCLSIHQKLYLNTYFILNFALLVPGFLIPFTISLVCYSRLARSISGINICRQQGKLIKRKSRKMMVVCLMIFGLCFTPMGVIRTVLLGTAKFYPGQDRLISRLETAYYVSWILSLTNCCLDPLIYCFASQNFTAALRNSLRKIGVGFHTTRQELERGSTLTAHPIRTPRLIRRGSRLGTHL